MLISRAAANCRPASSGRRADDRFHRLVSSNIIGIVTAVAEKIDTANDAFLHIVGYSRDDLERGEISWRALTPQEYAHLDDQALTEPAARGEYTPFRKEYIRKDGTRVPVLVGAVKIAHEPLEAACFIIDRTAQHKVEVDLANAMAEKEALLRQKEILLREVNHRVKNNLQIVSSLLMIQKNRVEAPEARTALGEAISRVSAIAEVHNSLYSTGDATEIEMGSYLRSLCEGAHRSGVIAAKQCCITVDAQRIVLPTDRAITVALVTTELLMNIAKYCARLGTGVQVRIRLQRHGDDLRLEVEDNGPGMPSDFDPDRSAGLGIKIVTALIRQYGGRLTFEPLEPGTRVGVDWPQLCKTAWRLRSAEP
jgi:PAS domain S-box-containing protein